MTELKLNEIIKALFEYINEFTKEEITQIELAPILCGYGLYLTGFRKQGYEEFEAHIKRLKVFKTEEKVGEEISEFTYATEPMEEMWINTNLLEQLKLSILFHTFKHNFFKMKSFDVAKITYKDEGMPINDTLGIVFETKRMACRYTLQFRKQHMNVSQKFLHFGEAEEKEQTELDIVTSATE
jgi:hypothetical protein